LNAQVTRPGRSTLSGGASPATSTGSARCESLTWDFAADGPVDVYRLAVATSVANRSAAAPLMPGSRCW
jgi:hypothetical protein